jgi:hypothetical protein
MNRGISRSSVISIILLLVFQALTGSGQNYEAIKSDGEYLFQDSLTKEIISIRIDSVANAGDSTLYYNFKHIYPTENGCWMLKGAWIGDTVIQYPDGKFQFHVSMLDYSYSMKYFDIRSRASLNETWVFSRYAYQNHYLEATISGINYQSFLGVSDSVKIISLTLKDSLGNILSNPINNQVILLSKHFGMIRLPMFDQFCMGTPPFYSLLSAPAIPNGISNLRTLDIFDFQPGDEFHTASYQHGPWNPFQYEYGASIRKILTRTDYPSGDSVNYTITVCESYLAYFQDTIIVSYNQQDTISQTYCPDYSQYLETEPLEATERVFWQHPGMGRLGEQLIGPADQLYKAFGNYELWSREDTCFHPIVFDGIYFGEYFLEGLGGPYYHYDDFFFGTSYNDLKYYNKGGQSWGTPMDCDSILQVGLHTRLTAGDVSISPNPSSGIVQIRIPGQSGKCCISIVSIRGNILMNLSQSDSLEIHDLSVLKPGIYLVIFQFNDGTTSWKKILRQ